MGLRFVVPHVCAIPAATSKMAVHAQGSREKFACPTNSRAVADTTGNPIVPAKPRARMTMMKLLVQEFGISGARGGGMLPLTSMVECSLNALQQSEEKTRKAATAAIIAIGQSIGQEKVVAEMDKVVKKATDEEGTGTVVVNPGTVKMVKQKLIAFVPVSPRAGESNIDESADPRIRHRSGKKDIRLLSKVKPKDKASSTLRPLKFTSGSRTFSAHSTNGAHAVLTGTINTPLTSKTLQTGLGPAFDIEEESLLNSIERESLGFVNVTA